MRICLQSTDLTVQFSQLYIVEKRVAFLNTLRSAYYTTRVQKSALPRTKTGKGNPGFNNKMKMTNKCRPDFLDAE